MMAVLMVLMALAACARAELYAYDYDSTYNVCANFDGELPQDVASALEGFLREGDEVICGARKRKCYVRKDREGWDASALVAVRRGEDILLVHASGVNGAWDVTVESDSFLADGEAFSITTPPQDEGTLLSYCIAVGDTVYTVIRQTSGGKRLWLTQAERTLADGSVFTLTCVNGRAIWRTARDGEAAESGAYDAVLPRRLAAWTAGAYPKSEAELQAFMAAHAPALEADEAYICGVNLRERATGDSRSWGRYTARVRILSREPGKQAPWFHVQVGNLDGWVSGMYLVTPNGEETDRLCAAAAHVHDAARARTQTGLYDRPGGAQTGTVPEGTLVHVLAEADGWLHVILPRAELTWETDWDGTYGFVKAQDMAVGVCKADAVWRE